MGAGISAFRHTRDLQKRQQNSSGFSCFSPSRNYNEQTLVIVFSQCITDVSWKCVIALIELYGERMRLHAATDDYSNIKNIGDKNMLKYLNKQLFVHKVDLRDELSVEEFYVDILKMEQSIDALVIHIDQMCVKPLKDTGSRLVTSAFETNFLAPLMLIKNILPTMKKQKNGRIICLNTVAGVIGIPFHSVYCSTKFAIEGLMESIAAECIEHSITASVIETSLDEEQSPSRVILELPTESHSSHDEEMIFEYDRMDETVSKLEHGSLLRCLNVPKISKTIKDIIEHKQPKFRYIIGKSTANITNEKLKDPRGNTTINELAKFFMNTDME